MDKIGHCILSDGQAWTKAMSITGGQLFLKYTLNLGPEQFCSSKSLQELKVQGMTH